MSQELNKKIRKARLAFLNDKPFWGNVLTIPYEITETVPTLGTDGVKFYINPKFIENFNQDNLKLFIAHEFLHILLSHTRNKRMKFAITSQRKWMSANLAADYVVNNVIKEEFNRLPKDVYYDSTFAHMTFEQIFNELYKEEDNKFQERIDSIRGDSFDSNDNSFSNPNSQSTTNETLEELLDGFSDEEIKENKNDKNSSSNSKEETVEDINNQIPEQLNRHKIWERRKEGIQNNSMETMMRNILIQANLQGKLPAGLRREVDDILHPPIPIRDIISNFVLEKSKSEKSWKRPRKRFYPPTYLPVKSKRNKLHIAVCFDTSGSISKDLLSEFYASIKYLFSFFKNNLNVIVFQADYIIQGENIITHIDQLRNIKFKGGGGTSFIGVFQRIEKEYSDIRGLIYITDTRGSYPKKEPNFPTIWLVPESKRNHHNKPPFGNLIFYQNRKGKYET